MENKQANEAAYQKRVDQLEKKEKKADPDDDDDWLNAKGVGEHD